MTSTATVGMVPEELITIPDVQRILGGCSRQTVNRLVASGRLKKVKVGSHTKFRPSEVQRYIDSQTE